MKDFPRFKDAFVKAEVSGTIGTLSFCNEAKRNALNMASWMAIPAAVRWLMKQQIRVIVVQGEGGNFSAGADISEFDTVRKDPNSARAYESSNSEAFAALRDVPIPTIANIQGYCLGGGFGLAAACDLRLAEADAIFSVPAARLGLGYPVDAMADIVEAIGQQNTKRLLFTAQQFSAEHMMQMGFLSSVEAGDTHYETIAQMSEEIANLAPLTHQATKLAITAESDDELDKAIFMSDATFDSEDYIEGRAAFREKRKPVFGGN